MSALPLTVDIFYKILKKLLFKSVKIFQSLSENINVFLAFLVPLEFDQRIGCFSIATSILLEVLHLISQNQVCKIKLNDQKWAFWNLSITQLGYALFAHWLLHWWRFCSSAQSFSCLRNPTFAEEMTDFVAFLLRAFFIQTEPKWVK